MKKNSAFSLIELSIVILIIGILIAGVTQSSRLIKQFRIKTAQTLTQSSPVASIKNLAAWYETSLDSSFIASETDEGGLLSTWYDNNPQSSSKINATQATGANKPNYNTSNGVPLVSFVNQDYFNLPNGTVPYDNAAYTVFFVSSVDANCTCGIIGSGTYNVSNHISNAFRYSDDGRVVNYWWNNDLYTGASTVTLKQLQIFAYTYNQTTRKVHVNGTLNNTDTPASIRASTSINNTIGSTFNNTEYLTNGKIGEIIIFDRALKDEERRSVENYLGKKFSIKVN